MLKVFCQFLHGEGDFVRHLKKMGYVVGHVQSYIGESERRRLVGVSLATSFFFCVFVFPPPCWMGVPCILWDGRSDSSLAATIARDACHRLPA